MKHGSSILNSVVAMRRLLVVLMALSMSIVFISCGSNKYNQAENEQVTLEVSDYVDLGLPSGTLWATRNVGASAPEDEGDYFSWGETEPKETYSWNTYKWIESSEVETNHRLTKYNSIDRKTELDPTDDAACAHYPNGRTPSSEQIQELCKCCTWKWSERNGMPGQLVIGPNGKAIFFPAAGFGWFDSLESVSSEGYYLSRTLFVEDPNPGSRRLPTIAPVYLNFNSFSKGAGINNCFERPAGCSVRAVHITQD